MKKLFIILIILILIGCKGTAKTVIIEEEAEAVIEEEMEADEDLSMFIPNPAGDLPVTSFREVWGYVVAGQEASLKRGYPITDVCYFGAEVDMYGSLSKVPDRKKLASFSGKVHLVVVCSSSALTYFTLMPGSPQRSALIKDLISETEKFDGLNIDFENIPQRSAEAFLSFLRELRAGLPANKMLTIALYARVRKLTNDVYDYETIKPIVDRIFIMGYDEHWGGGPAGPVSTIQWCRRVANYSLSAIGTEKLIMGIPLYGRAWASQNHHRALIHTTTEHLKDTHKVTDVKRDNGTPFFDYNANISVKVYYEDEYSISARFVMYKSMNINKIGFWRLGQETLRVWDILRLE